MIQHPLKNPTFLAIRKVGSLPKDRELRHLIVEVRQIPDRESTLWYRRLRSEARMEAYSTALTLIAASKFRFISSEGSSSASVTERALAQAISVISERGIMGALQVFHDLRCVRISCGALRNSLVLGKASLFFTIFSVAGEVVHSDCTIPPEWQTALLDELLEQRKKWGAVLARLNARCGYSLEEEDCRNSASRFLLKMLAESRDLRLHRIAAALLLYCGSRIRRSAGKLALQGEL